MKLVTANDSYRYAELNRVSAALLACESLLIVSEVGGGKSYFAYTLGEYLKQNDYPFLVIPIETSKQIMLGLCEALGIDNETIEGKKKTVGAMMSDIVYHCSRNSYIFIVDDAHRHAPAIRLWLERIMHQASCPVLLLATAPPARDIFLKLPRIELAPLKDQYIREIMIAKAQSLGIELKPSEYSRLQASCGGNPMLAERVIKEKYLGIESMGLDHTQWVDGTPILIAFLMCFMIIRFIGLGLNNTSLYLLGGVITTAIGVSRILIFSLPKRSNKL